MILEYAQLLSTAHRVLDGTQTDTKPKRWVIDDYREDVLYKASHINHPSGIWCRQSKVNYIWLFELFSATCAEYTYRYNRVHATENKLINYLFMPPSNIPEGAFTQPTPAMSQYPQCIVEGDSVASYQSYYRVAKAGFARWTNRYPPEFMAGALASPPGVS